jgi:NAD(P)-dependent dehydrogenase (short-subunit alcohol dehydrogenase family)
MNSEDKVVVVTGGASGIGLALCTRFCQDGAHVVLSDLHQDDCQEKAAAIGALPVAADVGKDEHIAHLVAATLEKTAISTDVVSDTVMEAIVQERFLISTHDSVMRLFELKGQDYERYIASLREKRLDWIATDEAQKEVA